MIKKYRRRPMIVEAVRWKEDNFDEVAEFLRSKGKELKIDFQPGGVKAGIETTNGLVFANPGDMIIKDAYGQFYPCHPAIFNHAYTEEIE